MATFYALGKYTAQGYQGFCKDPKSDRAQAARTAAEAVGAKLVSYTGCLLYTSPSPRDLSTSRMPSSA